ncbi:hypothetical protein EC968_005680, partial [Mortierella alpina]
MNPKRKAAAAPTSTSDSASDSVPAPVTAPIPSTATTSDADPTAVADPDPATPALETPALEDQACAAQQPQAAAIRPETSRHSHSDDKENMSEQVDLITEQSDTHDSTTEHVNPFGKDAATARRLSRDATPSLETTGTIPTEAAAALASNSEAMLDSRAEPYAEDQSDTSSPTKKRVGPDQDKSGIRGGGAKRRFTNPKPS